MKLRTERLQNKSVIGAIAVFCCLLWGSAYPCIKIGYRLFSIGANDAAARIVFAGERFTLSGILVILIGSLLEGRFLHPHKTSWKAITIVSLNQTVLQYIFFYGGLAHTSGVRSSIIGSLATFLAILFACYLFRQEKMTAAKVLGCVLGFAGVVLVNLSGSLTAGSVSLTGEGFIFFSTVTYALSSCLLRHFTRREHPIMLMGWQFFVGGLTLMLLGSLFGGTFHRTTGAGVCMLLYLAFISAAAYTLWSVLLKYNRVSDVTVYRFLNPLFGVVLSSIFLHESSELGIFSIGALVLICAGIYIVNRAQPGDAIREAKKG